MGCGFETFIRRDLIVRVRFLAQLSFFRFVKTRTAIKSNSAAIVERLFSMLVLPSYLMAVTVTGTSIELDQGFGTWSVDGLLSKSN